MPIDPSACRDCWVPARPPYRRPPVDWQPWDEPAPQYSETGVTARRAARTNPTTKETP